MRLLEDNINVVVKPQYIDHIPRVRSSELLFRSSELLFRFSELLFRSELLFFAENLTIPELKIGKGPVEVMRYEKPFAKGPVDIKNSRPSLHRSIRLHFGIQVEKECDKL
jgi:hypothetical protein